MALAAPVPSQQLAPSNTHTSTVHIYGYQQNRLTLQHTTACHTTALRAIHPARLKPVRHRLKIRLSYQPYLDVYPPTDPPTCRHLSLDSFSTSLCPTSNPSWRQQRRCPPASRPNRCQPSTSSPPTLLSILSIPLADTKLYVCISQEFPALAVSHSSVFSSQSPPKPLCA